MSRNQLAVDKTYQFNTATANTGTLALDVAPITNPVVTLQTGLASSGNTVVLAFTATANLPNGVYIQIDSEKMYITSGGGAMVIGNNTLTVTRGAWSTTAASHTTSATVTVPGYKHLNLLPIASVPNQNFYGSKVTTDINYVVVLANSGAGDTFPQGAPTIILADNSSNLGTFHLVAPAGSHIWLLSAGAGAAGASSGGGGGTATLSVSFAGGPALEGLVYSAAFIAVGGTPPYIFTITSGSIPTGTTLSGNTIAGTPTALGTFSFIGKVTDNVGATATVSASIAVTQIGGTPAPNVSSSTQSLITESWGNGTCFSYTGTATLPSTWAQITSLVINAISPTGQSIEIGQYTPAGTSLTWTGTFSSSMLMGAVAQTGWSLQFVCYNSAGVPTVSPYTISGITVPAIGISALTGSEIGLWAVQTGGQLQAQLQASITVSQPGTYSLWTIGTVSGTIYHGFRQLPSGASNIQIGAQGDPLTSFPAPTTANDSVTFVAVPGAVNWQTGGVNPTTLTGALQSSAFTVSTPAANSTMASACYADVILYTKTGSGGAYTWSVPNMYATFQRFIAGVANPNWFYGRLYCQQGAGVGAAFVPLSGSSVAIVSDDSSTANSAQTGPNTSDIKDILNWGVPSDLNTTFRFWWTCASRQGTNAGGGQAVEVQQNCWSSGYAGTPYTDGSSNQWYDIVVDPTKSQIATDGTTTTINSAGQVVATQSAGFVNGGFEQGLVGWTASGAWASSTAQNHTIGGTHSAKCPTIGSGVALLYQFFTAIPGQVVAANAWVYGDSGATAAGVYLQADWFNSVGGSLGSSAYSSSLTAGAAAWTRFTSLVTLVAPAGTASLRLACFISGPTSGNWYFDDITVQVQSVDGPNYVDTNGALNTHIDGTTIHLDGSNNIVLNTSNLANMVLNSGFETGDLSGWANGGSGGVAVVTTPVYSGAYACQLTPAGTGVSVVGEAQYHACVPGNQFYVEVYVRSTSSAVGQPVIATNYFDGSGGFVSANNIALAAGARTSYVKLSGNFTIPSGCSQVGLQIYCQSETGTGALWYVDSVWLQPQTSTGSGMQPNGSGGVEQYLAPLGGLAFDGSGRTESNLGYTMQVNASNQIVLSNLPAVAGLPFVPSATYPAGSVICDTVAGTDPSTGLATPAYTLYRNPTGSQWVASHTPADMVAGAIATGVTLAAAQITAGTLVSGVVYAGQINCSQLNAGTIAAAISLTSPTISVTGGSPNYATVEIDSTNAVKVTDNFSNRYYALVLPGSVGVSGTTGGFVTVNMVSSSGGYSQGQLKLTDGNGGAGWSLLAHLISSARGGGGGVIVPSTADGYITGTLIPSGTSIAIPYYVV